MKKGITEFVYVLRRGFLLQFFQDLKRHCIFVRFQIKSIIFFKNGYTEVFLTAVQEQIGKIVSQRALIVFRIDFFAVDSAV